MSRPPDRPLRAIGARDNRRLIPISGRRDPDRTAELSGQGGRLLLVQDDSALRRIPAWELSELGSAVRALGRRP